MFRLFRLRIWIYCAPDVAGVTPAIAQHNQAPLEMVIRTKGLRLNKRLYLLQRCPMDDPTNIQTLRNVLAAAIPDTIFVYRLALSWQSDVLHTQSHSVTSPN